MKKSFKYFFLTLISFLIVGSVLLAVYLSRPEQKVKRLVKWGKIYQDIGRPDRAILKYEEALKIQPDSKLIRLELAKAFFNKRDLISSLKEIRKVLKAEPENVDAHLLRLGVFLNQKESKAVLKELADSQKLLDGNAQFHRIWGDVLFQNKNYDDAVVHYRKSISLEGTDRRVIRQAIIQSLIAKTDFGQAQSESALYIAEEGADADIHFLNYQIHRNMPDLKMAAKDLEDVLLKKPDHIDALTARAELRILNKDYDKALVDTKKVLALDPNHIFARFLQGSAFFSKGEHEKAKLDLELATISDPKFAQAHFWLAKAFERLGNPQQALAELNKVIELDPDEETARLAAARLTFKQGWNEGVVEYCQAVLKAEPENVSALRLLLKVHLKDAKYIEALNVLKNLEKLGVATTAERIDLLKLLIYSGQGQMAIDLSEEMVKKYSENAMLDNLMGLAYMSLKDVPRSIVFFKKSMDLDPDLQEPRMNLSTAYVQIAKYSEARVLLEEIIKKQGPQTDDARLRLAQVYVLEKNGEAALEQFQILNNKFPDNSSILQGIATSLLQLKRMEPLIPVLKKLVAKNPQNAAFRLYLGRAYQEGRQRLKAIQQFEKIRLLEPANPGLTVLGYLYVEERRIGKAVEFYKERLSQDPKLIRDMLSLILILLRTGQFSEADEKMLELSTQKVFFLYEPILLVHSDILAGRIEHAEGLLKKYTSDFPGIAVFLKQLVDFSREHPAEGKKLIRRLNLCLYENVNDQTQKALERLAKLEVEYSSLGIISFIIIEGMKEGNRVPEEMLRRTLRLLEVDPQNPILLNILGDLYYEDKNSEKAVEVFKKIIDITPGDLDAVMKLAIMLNHTGRPEEARKYYERILVLRPDSPNVLNNLAWLEWDAFKNREKAVAYAKRALEIAPNAGEIHDTLGWVFLENGDIENGLSHILQARARIPLNPSVRFHLAKAFYLKGDFVKAEGEVLAALEVRNQFFDVEEACKLLEEVRSAASRQSGAPSQK